MRILSHSPDQCQRLRIRRVVSYVDTIHIFIPGTALPANPRLWRQLQCYGQVGSVTPDGNFWGHRLELREPNFRPERIRSLATLLRSVTANLCRLDIANDFISEEPALTWEYSRQHGLLRWCRRRDLHFVDRSIYWDRPGTARNLVCYDDIGSKLDGAPCCHLEQRFIGSATIRRQGIQRLEDVLTLNPQALVAKHVKWHAAGERVVAKAKAHHTGGERQLLQLLKAGGWDQALTLKYRRPKLMAKERNPGLTPLIPTELSWKDQSRPRNRSPKREGETAPRESEARPLPQPSPSLRPRLIHDQERGRVLGREDEDWR